MTILVDTNVLLDIVTNDPRWKDWSLARMNDLALSDDLAINDIVFAELAPGFEKVEEVTAVVNEMGLVLRPIPLAALFLASKVQQRYKRLDGARDGVLPDFFIGAQAAVEGLSLLTRDARRVRSYFPTVGLISP